ncbi:MAG TPA: anti-sigma factor domain-containing protein [Symbiobacteriaceae bacterium]|nr:anti-sigma factor domain-containing protein [Symbiobacteriaceae bacterium]
MGKGVLLELTGRQGVVLTQQGEFKRVPLPKGAWDIGDEVEFAETQPAAWTRWGAVAAAAVVLLLAPVGWNVYADAQPQAIVTVDINPSLQLTLNRKDVVLKAEALNTDGELVLHGVKWERRPVNEVLTAVTSRAVEEHKLDPQSETGAVVVAVAPAKKEDLPQAQADRIRDKAYDAVTTVAGKASVVALEAKASEKAEAEATGLDVGKFLLYTQMEQKGLQVKPEDLKQQGPGKLMQGLGVNPSEIFSEAEKKHGGSPSSKSRSNGKSGSQQVNPPAVPANGQPGKSGTTDNKGSQKDDKSNKADDQNGTVPKGNSQSGGSDDKKSGQGDNKKSDRQDDKKPDSKNDQKNEHKGGGSGKDDGKKSTWTVPFLGFTVENPFAPRASEPGVDGSAGDSQKVDEKQEPQREEKEPAGPKEPEEKSSNGKSEDKPANGKGEDKPSGGNGNGNGNGSGNGHGNASGSGNGNGSDKGKGKP